METVGEFEYNTKDLIGHGAFAVVFKGRHRKNHNNVVAIKSITKKNLAKSQNLLGKEIKILKELTELHHENVVALLDCKETPHHVYLVMEYCNGGDLADYLHVKGTLSEDTIRLFLRQLAGAMKALNAKGIVHRDLKPQNILLCHSGKNNPAPHEIRLKIADFGFARFLQDGVMAATLCGSPMYMAPEVIMSLQYDAKADLWSIGTIVFQCLTGKAPFQAQTPQALKQYYEKNVNLAPKIPNGTSPELADLLMKLLKRNAKDRVEFDDFFKHPFLKKVGKPTSPVPVPLSRQRSMPRDVLRTLNESPMLGVTPVTPSAPGEETEELVSETAALPGSPASDITRLSPTRVTDTEEHDDFVLVPPNLPSENYHPSHSGSPKPSLQDVLRPSSSPRTVTFSPSGSPSIVTYHRRSPSPSPFLDSPTRPSYLPVRNSPTSPSPRPITTAAANTAANNTNNNSSEPVPVPSQKAAYQQIQASLQSLQESWSSNGSGPAGNAKSGSQASGTPPSSPKGTVPRSQPIGMRQHSFDSATDIRSLSPPTVQFMLGTPPGNLAARRRSLSGSGTPPPPHCFIPASPPLMVTSRSSPGTSPARKTSILSAGTGSPSRSAFIFNPPPLPSVLSIAAVSPTDSGSEAGAVVPRTSPSQPLVIPFGGRSPTEMMYSSVKHDNIILSGDMPKQGAFSDPLSELRAAFSATNTTNALVAFLPASPPTFVGSPSNNNNGTTLTFCGESPPSHRDHHHHLVASPHHYGVPRHSPYHHPYHHPYHPSQPAHVEGPLYFFAPELPAETLMESRHTETLAKLRFVLALVECIVDLARSKANPITALTDSSAVKKEGPEQLQMVSEGYRRLEQLVLYVRALQMLSSSLCLSREELKNGHLQPSNSVKTVVSLMNERYHHCLKMCKALNTQNLLRVVGVDPTMSAVTADKLLYNYAIEMCQTAALDELFGQPEECYRRYHTAQIVLHSLSQQVSNDHDKKLLHRYRDAVEKRLFVLQQQGFVFAYETT